MDSVCADSYDGGRMQFHRGISCVHSHRADGLLSGVCPAGSQDCFEDGRGLRAQRDLYGNLRRCGV